MKQEELRLVIHEIKKSEREKVLAEANAILRQYGRAIKYIPSVMEVVLDGKLEKGEKQ